MDVELLMTIGLAIALLYGLNLLLPLQTVDEKGNKITRSEENAARSLKTI